MSPVYLDHAASTPLDPAVAEVMTRCLHDPSLAANPAAVGHRPGREAHARVEAARAAVAALVNAAPREIIWTSGATEADNLAILGACAMRRGRGRHLVTALTEHAAVRECAHHLDREGWRVTWLRPDACGLIDAAAVEAALAADTVLVSIMHANNETGVIQDIAAIGGVCRRHGVLFHVDAAQSAGRLAIDLAGLPVDLLSLSAHKIYGPKGVGALYVREATLRRVAPLMHGGGQERGMRPGTVATHQVVGMGEALALARVRLAGEAAHLHALWQRLWARLSRHEGVLLNGHPTRHAGHILNVSVEGVEGESLHHGLCELAVGRGSACASGSGEASPVLRAMGRSSALARSAVRFSFGRTTTPADIDHAAEVFRAALAPLRRLSPVRDYTPPAAP